MKVIEKIREAERGDRVVFSFEFFPPKTEDGVNTLFERMERMVIHNPSFCDITWGASGSTADLTLEISNRMQNMVCVETMMHLTCTNMLCFVERMQTRVQWECPDCFVVADPNLIDKPGAGFESSGDLIATIEFLKFLWI
ncbi:hypothetical protein CsSME_00006485 [Camellia sinensis var. sinensis]